VPAVAVAVIGGGIAASAISVAQAAPDLPVKTPAQLLADIASTQKIPALTGTVVETTNLGLPRLPQAGSPTSLTSLITGSHTLKVYWRDAKHFRLAIPQAMTETDLIRNGGTLWLWQSASNTASKFSLAGEGTPNAKAPVKAPLKDLPPLTPQQAASEALQAVGQSTTVRVESPVTVAGEPAYQLVLVPKDSRSTIGSITIAIDAATSVPLRVQVFAKGSASPAFQVGYTQISYVAPAMANFSFTAPPGATYDDMTRPPSGHQEKAPSQDGTYGTYGSGWLAVAEVPQSALSEAMAGSSGAAGQQPAVGTEASPQSGTGVFGADGQAAIRAFLGAGKQVSGSWGSGQLIHTSLVNILIVGNEMYVGAVVPSVLESAVGQATPAGS
jgi:outer membrane lipoprotein-sorting protein